jgi:hypothetical protein
MTNTLKTYTTHLTATITSMNSKNEKNKSGVPEPATTANSHYFFEDTTSSTPLPSTYWMPFLH